MDWEPNAAPVQAFPPSQSASPSSGPSPNGATRFLALDTNILIDQLPLITDLHARLVSAASPTWLLISQQAINELDGLSKSDKPALVTAARAATAWLDATARAPRLGRRARVRIESRAERAAAAIAEGEGVGIAAREDDAVLSCCLWFQRGADVRLWTHDRNLALLAEGSGVHTIPRVRLARLLREAGVEPHAMEGMELDEEVMDAEDPFPTERAVRNAERVAETMPERGAETMPSRHAYTPWVPRSVSTTPPDAWVSEPVRRSSSAHGRELVTPGHATVLPPPGALAEALHRHSLIHDLDALLADTLAPVAALEADTPADALGHARAIAARLAALESPGELEPRRELFHALANAQTLASFLAGERVRPGEAAEALLVLADELGRFVPLDRRVWAAVAERLRLLP
ncbi:hypothetical protein CspeluHIS016_0503070 [Cutaneotrichosporon spelunceum]|uniref:PIN domain-containing protein n=1 Tax=Cutaneotrichosporon spelunceum TaxID=1672016 RepID=A0AAD3TWM5_9TREE|nr:hypothetical protein CspeluHIS016_0503070 [Cutaneotrichosporon spelunceum]